MEGSWLVTVNCGAVSPNGPLQARAQRMGEWARDAVATRKPALVFGQEVPSGWETSWGPDYVLIEGTGPSYRARSVILADRTQVAEIWQLELPTASYHGTYLSAGRLTLPGLDRPLTVVSVHASPSPAAAYLDRWPSTVAPPPARPGAGPNAGELWDADMVLATLGALNRPLLAAGDFNECLAWDDTHEGGWGADFFARADEAGLPSVTERLWSEERKTRFLDDRGYQLDHVLASEDVLPHLVHAEVDEGWTQEFVRDESASDHAPVWVRWA
jgi:endonuclease/exonuclease/phosphatase family metal-dependent hydrolase